MKLRMLLAGLSAICCLGTTLTTLAGEVNPALTDTHSFYLGAFFQDSDGSLGSSARGERDSDIEIDGLGLDTRYDSWLAAYQWRFSERWMLDISAHVYDSKGEAIVARTFEYDGREFEAGARLESEIKLNTYLVDVVYSLYKSDRAEFQLGGGLHAFDYDVQFNGTVFLDDQSRTDTVSANKLLAPLPNLRVNALYAFNPNWAIRGSLGWLSANIDNWDGDYTYVRVSADYRFGDHFGIGVGYRYYDMNVTHQGAHAKSTFDLSYQGPALYLNYGF